MEYSMEELLPIVTKLSEKYTGKESTSLTYEMAGQLMEAVIYCIEENYLLSGQSGDNEMITLTGNEKAEKIYRNGYKLVVEKTLQAKKLFDEIITDFHSYGNRNYYDTVIKGMPAFFLKYDAMFCPQNHILTLDYPVMKPLEHLCGVNVIYQFLSYIRLEQLFLSAFTEHYVREILLRFHNDYEELFINVCRVILRNILGLMIVGKKIGNEVPEIKDSALLYDYVKGKTQEEVEIKLLALLKILVDNGYGHNEKLLEYLQGDIKDFSFELIQAEKNNCIENILSFTQS